jgi:hypothetical protein
VARAHPGAPLVVSAPARTPVAEPGLRYLARRVAVYLGARERVLATLIAHRARADGWFAVEALQALSGSRIAAGRVGSVRLRGDRDLDLEIDGSPTVIRVRSLPGPDARRPAGPANDWKSDLASELAEAVTGGATLLAVAYPLRAEDPAWREATGELERASGARLAEELQVQLAGPERVTVSLWVPGERDSRPSVL